MTPPDEKPRQSVANLIGRFEQQGKKQAPPPFPVVPRSSSVSSQIAGDAAKEELKAKREWPPKPVAPAEHKSLAPTFSGPPPSSISKSPAVSPQPIPDPAPSVDTPTTPTPASPELVRSPPSQGKAVVTGKSTPTAGTRRTVESPAKSRSPVGSSSTAKSLASPPKTSLQSSVSQPLRFQHTGQSVASNPSTTRQARPVPRTAPSTPSRPKSSSARNQTVARPKTPSSGLFAPTAASLARSRNAPPPPPPPIKKATLSSDAAERLSKPTAASLSKARAPITPVSSPARAAKSTSTGPTSRGPSILKVGRTPPRKEANMKEEIKSDPASISSEPARDSDHPVADHTENGHDSGTAAASDVGSPENTHGPLEVVGDAMHDPTADKVHPESEVHPEQHEGEHPVEGEAHNHEQFTQTLEEVAHAHEQAVYGDAVPKSAESHAGEVTSNGDGSKGEPRAPGNDLEDIVNLLEGVSSSRPRPQSIATIPDEHGEIPDEY